MVNNKHEERRRGVVGFVAGFAHSSPPPHHLLSKWRMPKNEGEKVNWDEKKLSLSIIPASSDTLSPAQSSLFAPPKRSNITDELCCVWERAGSKQHDEKWAELSYSMEKMYKVWKQRSWRILISDYYIDKIISLTLSLQAYQLEKA